MSQRLKADVAVTLCTVLWGATFAVVKGARFGVGLCLHACALYYRILEKLAKIVS